MTRLEQLGGKLSAEKKAAISDRLALTVMGGMEESRNNDRLWRRGEFGGTSGNESRYAFADRRVIRTKEGPVGLAPSLAAPGDCVGVFGGGRLPLVLRPNGGNWLLISGSYMHGIMDGEAFLQGACEEF
jgi:hypothetical protein